MSRSGREPDWSRVAAAGQLLREAFDPPPPTPPATATATRIVPLTPTAHPPSPTAPLPTATRPAPTAVPTPTVPREYVLTLGELDAELARAIQSGSVPLREPRVRLVPSD